MERNCLFETCITTSTLVASAKSPPLTGNGIKRDIKANNPDDGHFFKVRPEKRIPLRQNNSCYQNQREEGLRIRGKRCAVCKEPQDV